MGFFGSLAKFALTVVETPVAVVKDIATLDGSITEQGKPYTLQKLEEIGNDYERIKDSLED